MTTLSTFLTISALTPRVTGLAKNEQLIAMAFLASAILLRATSKPSNGEAGYHRLATPSDQGASSDHVASRVHGDSMNHGMPEIHKRSVIHVLPAIRKVSAIHAVGVSGVRSCVASGGYYDSGDRAHFKFRLDATNLFFLTACFLSGDRILASRFAPSVGLPRQRDAYGGAAPTGRQRCRRKTIQQAVTFWRRSTAPAEAIKKRRRKWCVTRNSARSAPIFTGRVTIEAVTRS